MKMQQNGGSLTTTMKTTISKSTNNNVNNNNSNNISHPQSEGGKQKDGQINHEILLLFDIKVNDMNQLSNIYAMTFDQSDKKVLECHNFEIGYESTAAKLKQALDVINNIQKSYISNPNFLIIYPKKAISNALFKIYRENKFSPGDLSFTHTYISLGQIMPIQYVSDENILFKQFYPFLDLVKDEEIAKQILPMQNIMNNNNNNNTSKPSLALDTSPMGLICKQNVRQSYSNSVDLNGLAQNSQHTTAIFNTNPSQIVTSITEKSTIDAETKTNNNNTSSQKDPVLSLSSITPINQAGKKTEMSQFVYSSNKCISSQVQNQQNQSLNFNAPQTGCILQNQEKKQQNISNLFDLKKEDEIQKQSSSTPTSFLYSNNMPSTQNQSYSMQGIKESTIFSTGLTESSIFSSFKGMKRPSSISLDSGQGGSSLFQQLNQQVNKQDSIKQQQNQQQNLNYSPLGIIAEIPNQEMSIERNPSKIENGASYKITFTSNSKDFEFSNFSSCSSICSNSTYASNRFINEQKKGPVYTSQLNFYVLVVKLIRLGFQFKKENTISFKNKLSDEIKKRYSSQIQNIILEEMRKVSTTQVEQEKSSKPEKQEILQNNSVVKQQEFQNMNMKMNDSSNPKEMMQNTQNAIMGQIQPPLSRKQILFQQQWANQYIGKAAAPSLQVYSPKTNIQEELTARSQQVQQRLQLNEENKMLDLLFVIDFECNQPGYEIIEFPILVIDLKKLKIIDTFHTYVKPTTSPRINPYIQKITGICQKDVANAPAFVEVMQKIEVFLTKYQDYEACILYDCDSDCNYLRNELINKNYMPKSDLFFSYINLRNVFPLEVSGGVINKSLSHAQQILQMEFQGNKHKGIDDARNQALVCIELAKRGYHFSQFMIQPQFYKQEPKQCVKNNIFNLYEFNSKFLLIKLDFVPQEATNIQTTQRGQPASLTNPTLKYTKFTCFLTEKNDQLNQIHRIKDSTFYYDLVTAQASGAGVSHVLLSSHPRNIYHSHNSGQTNQNNYSNQGNNYYQSQNNNQYNNQRNNNNYNNQSQKYDNQRGKQIDEHVKQVERTFYACFSNYLKKYNVQRNQTAVVLMGFDKNTFSNFQKAFNLIQYEKELFYNEKTIYIDDNLVSFTGFLDVYKIKDPNNMRKNSVCGTPHKNRKRSMSDDLLATSIKVVNHTQPVQLQVQASSNHSVINLPTTIQSSSSVSNNSQRKNSLKNNNIPSPMIKPVCQNQLIENTGFSLSNSKDDYTIIHQADIINKSQQNDNNQQKSSRKRSCKESIAHSSLESKVVQKQNEKQQIQPQQQSLTNQSTITKLNQPFQQNVQANYSIIIEDKNSIQNQEDINNIQKSSTAQNNQNNQNSIISNSTVSTTTNNNNNSIQNNSTSIVNNYTKEQICSFILNDEFSINFINFILVNRKKLQEYQNLAYHWQFFNNKPQ